MLPFNARLRYGQHVRLCMCSGPSCHPPKPAPCILSPPALALAQIRRMEELWEEHGSAPNAVQAVRDGLNGDFSRASVARQLKAMGLKRGALTARQVGWHSEDAELGWCHREGVFRTLTSILVVQPGVRA